jgi:uncharacterized repeat protein (TIGR03803 family)
MSKLRSWSSFTLVPARSRTGNGTRKFGLSTMVCIVLVFCAATAIAAPAPTFTTLVNFDGTNGGYPYASLIQGTDGNFYGTTSLGGASNACSTEKGIPGCGTVFKVTPGGTVTTLHSFDNTDGAGPWAGLVQAADGNFYGTTYGFVAGADGNHPGYGTVFKITAGGTLTTLYHFCSQTDCTDGDYPYAGLVQATDRNFYGTTSAGGDNNNNGTVFKITPEGTLTTLHSFDDTDGSYIFAGLLLATDGNFYGTAVGGGNDYKVGLGIGTVFKITAGGTLTTLHQFDFNPAGGANPYAGLVQAIDGNFYGTAGNGGANGDGTVFRITAGGKFLVLHSFNGTDGEYAVARLVQATDGNFYGTTDFGGASSRYNCPSQSPGCGTIFKITPGGTLTTLYNFCSQTNCTDGAYPFGGLVQATDGNLYGTTAGGGVSNACVGGCGTVFSLDVGLGPFVETEPTSGMAGADITILGNNLTGATGVTFNGTSAIFTVVSSSEITATVPSGATTGKVEVTTPSGTLTSNVNFRVSVCQG